jgi:uncharacterized protein
MSSKADFPFYDGEPVEITPRGWILLLLAVAAALALLVTLPFSQFPLNLIPAVLYTGLPLVTLTSVSRGKHAALFGEFGFQEFGLAIGFGVLTILASFATALVLLQFTSMNDNPAAAVLSSANTFDIVVFLVRTFIQLIGEEIMTVLLLLAVLWFSYRHLRLPRTTAMVLAVIVSTLWFGAVHLPTYNWNFVQAFGGIGMARLMLSAAYLVTRNLWVSTGAHVFNDWFEFFMPMLLAGGHTPIEAGT